MISILVFLVYQDELITTIIPSSYIDSFTSLYNPFDLMSTGEEELPRGTMVDWFEMIEVVTEIENYLKNM